MTESDNRIETLLVAYEQLERQQGWQLFMAWVKASKAKLVNDLANDINPNTVMRTSGGIAQLTLVETFIASQVQVLTKQKVAKERIDGKREPEQPGQWKR